MVSLTLQFVNTLLIAQIGRCGDSDKRFCHKKLIRQDELNKALLGDDR